MDEYVSREELRRQACCIYSYGGARYVSLAVIEKMATADVAPVVRGLWIPVRESEITGWNPEFAGYDPIGGYVCSECKEEAVFDCNDRYVLSRYCPNCGAKMDKEA